MLDGFVADHGVPTGLGAGGIHLLLTHVTFGCSKFKSQNDYIPPLLTSKTIALFSYISPLPLSFLCFSIIFPDPYLTFHLHGVRDELKWNLDLYSTYFILVGKAIEL